MTVSNSTTVGRTLFSQKYHKHAHICFRPVTSFSIRSESESCSRVALYCKKHGEIIIGPRDCQSCIPGNGPKARFARCQKKHPSTGRPGKPRPGKLLRRLPGQEFRAKHYEINLSEAKFAMNQSAIQTKSRDLNTCRLRFTRNTWPKTTLWLVGDFEAE